MSSTRRTKRAEDARFVRITIALLRDLFEWQGRTFMKSILIGVALAGATAVAGNTWRVGQGDVRVICPMTIGGSFDAKTTAISGAVTASATDARALDGSVAVDLRTLDTGIGLRNEHLRDNYLEV